MRSALICVFLTLIVKSQEVSQSSSINEFRPTPIPLTEWHQEQREGRTKNLNEPASTAATSSQGHYWEDALKHSVYLTLVRDKIDQLIAQGDVISPDKKSEPYIPRDIDDHDLWEKIKSASFDRIKEDEPDTYGDVTILAKGRLLEEKGRYRFAEDDRNQQKCYNDTCMNNVKAIWSVKRVRQRDSQSTVGSHHNELTFSVISQPAKKQKKPYENPIRTFTVREKQEEQNHYHHLERPKLKPARMVWFHKNIVPTPKYHRQSLDRIFSSLFFDDDEEPPHRHHGRPPPYGSVYNPYSKVAYPGSPSDQLQQKKPLQPAYKMRTKIIKTYPSGQMHPTLFTSDSSPNSPYPSQSADHRYVLPIQPVTTTKSNNLSATLSPLSVPPNSAENGTVKENLLNTTTEYTSKTTEIITVPPRYPNYGRPKNPTMKVKYYPEHIRPPVYNAPPGVFVTMDKKPFKPMPPLKLIHGKPIKSSRPSDFRPSPQVLDIQFSEPDPFSDTAFRPITVNYDNNVTTEKTKTYEYSEHEDRRPSLSNRKPPKKHENIKAEKITTSAPEIITAHNEIQEIESPNWNIPGALRKTTPMAVAVTEKIETTQKEEEYLTTTTTTTPPPTTTTPPPTTTTAKKRTTTTTEPPERTTTPKPNKRTRPPPDFKKTERKDKKNKRRTTTSTKTPDTLALKAEHDLTPQASSAATSSSKLHKDSSKKPISTTTSSPTTKNSATFKSTTNTNETTPSSSNTWTKNYTTSIASTKKTNATTLPSIKVTTTNAPSPKTSTTISTVNTTSINTPARNLLTTNPATISTVISTTTAKATTKATKLFTNKATTTKTTTSTEPPTTTIVTEPTNFASTTQPKNKNRFRQSTLMQKGTSVNHDKWSVIPTSVEKSKSILPVSGTFSPRRKGSNFQGYITSTAKNTDLDDVDNHISSPYMSKTSTTEKPITTKVTPQGETIQHDELDNESSASTIYDQIQYPENDVEDIDGIESLDAFEGPGGGGNDFVYDVLPLQTTKKNEFEQVTYDEPVATKSFPPKNKTKCKKKKSQNLTTTSEQEPEKMITTIATMITTTATTPTTTSTTTSQAPSTAVNVDPKNFTKPKEKARDPDIFETLFGFNLDEGFNLNDTDTLDIQEQQSEHKLKYLEPEENENESEGTFDSFDEKSRRQAGESEYDIEDYDDEKKTILDGNEEDSPFDSEELKNLAESEDQDDYPNIEDEDHMSFLELMGMQ